MNGKQYMLRIPEKWYEIIDKKANEIGLKRTEYIRTIIYEAIKKDLKNEK